MGWEANPGAVTCRPKSNKIHLRLLILRMQCRQFLKHSRGQKSHSHSCYQCMLQKVMFVEMLMGKKLQCQWSYLKRIPPGYRIGTMQIRTNAPAVLQKIVKIGNADTMPNGGIFNKIKHKKRADYRIFAGNNGNKPILQ